MTPEPQEPQTLSTDDVDLEVILSALGRELDHAAASCGVLQWSISTLLDKVHHPDLGAEIHMLQDIDRLQQTLSDIGRVLVTGAHRLQGQTAPFDEIGAVIRLESLRQRLGLADDTETPATGHDGPDPDEEVTWL